MVELNKIYNADCLEFISTLEDNSIDVVMTSPPYNTCNNRPQENFKKHKDDPNYRGVRVSKYNRYDTDVDNRTPDEYAEWVGNIFRALEPKLKENGVILWNVSYGVDSNNGDEYGINNSIWYSLLDVINTTDFAIGDVVCWEKSNCIPVSCGNKLSRIWEPVFVFCRKSEYRSYYINSQDTCKKKGIQFRKPYRSLIKTSTNNDGSCELNRATYCSELCEKLFDIYAPKGGVVYDPFMGTGTTAVACITKGLNYIGTEISAKQVEYANNRIKEFKGNSLWFK